MATETGVWTLQEVRDKQLAGEWDYTEPADLYTWGDNGVGRLGHNNQTKYSSPTQVPGSWSKVFITGPGNQKYLLLSKESGTLWGVGESYEGALGLNDGAASLRSSPIQIGTDTTWSNAVGGENMTIATKTNGTLWMWGDNTYGGLGANLAGGMPYTKRSSPIQVGTDTTWSTNIANGQGAAWAIKTNGTLWAWGNNQQYAALGLNQQGPGTNYSSPVQVGTNTTWSSLGAGSGQGGAVAAFKTDGTLWVWGRNNNGQLGQNSINSPSSAGFSSPTQLPGTTWASVSVGGAMLMATKTDGTLWSWGYNNFGLLGHNDNTKRSSPTQIGTDTTWSQVSGKQRAGYIGVAIKTDGTMWAWGNNDKGELGQNNKTQRSSPVQIPGTWSSFDSTGYNGNIAALKTP
jgi:alpha-tubulin suppressor-like RCC1 family protein